MSSVVVVPLCSALVKARLDWRRWAPLRIGQRPTWSRRRRGPGADDTRRAVPTGDRDGQRRRDAGPLVVAGYERRTAREPDAAAAPDGRSVPAGRLRQCLSAVEAPHGVAGPQPAFHQAGPVDEILDAGGRCVHGGALVLGRRRQCSHGHYGTLMGWGCAGAAAWIAARICSNLPSCSLVYRHEA